MSDPSTNGSTASTAAAEFFKNKKKKGKKVFTFNANLVDADTVTQTIHVDAPALSNDPTTAVDGGVGSTVNRHPTLPSILEKSNDPSNSNNHNSNNAEWDDTAVVSSIGNAATTTSLLLEATTTTTSELGSVSLNANTSAGGGGVSNIGTLSTNEYYYDDTAIAEKLRVEETRAQLAEARLGMERQAAAAAAQKEAEIAKKKATTASSSSSAAGGGGSGGRWIPAHLRNPTAMSSTSGTNRFGGATSTKLDVASNELFPDLQTAVDQIEKEKQVKQQPTKLKLNMKKIVPSLTPNIKKKKISTTTASTTTTTTTSSTTIGMGDDDADTTVTTAATENVTIAEGDASDRVEPPAADGSATTAAVLSTPVETPSDDPTTTTTVTARDNVVIIEPTPMIKKSTTLKKKKKDLSTFKASS